MSGYILKTRYEKETGKSWKEYNKTIMGGVDIPYTSWLEAEIDRLTARAEKAEAELEKYKTFREKCMEKFPEDE